MRRWDCAKDKIQWQNRKIKIELLAPGLKIYILQLGFGWMRI